MLPKTVASIPMWVPSTENVDRVTKELNFLNFYYILINLKSILNLKNGSSITYFSVKYNFILEDMPLELLRS